MGALRLGCGAGLVLALIFNVVALATPAWWTSAEGTSCGLFKCYYGSWSVNVTRGIAENVAMAFNILAMITLLGASALVLLAGKDEDKDRLGKIGAILAIVGAFFILVGMATYTGIVMSGTSISFSIPWGYSYAFGWTAFCLALICGVVSLIGK